MEIGQLIQTLIGTIVGGCIVIAANWISVQEERKKNAQEWYEQTYVTNGIDPILTYLLSMDLHIMDKWNTSFMQLPKLDLMPVEALSKIQSFLDTGTLSGIIGLAQSSLHTDNTYVKYEAMNAISETQMTLLKLRRELLTTIANKVRNKTYEMDTHLTRKELDTIFRNFTKNVDEIAKGREDKDAY